MTKEHKELLEKQKEKILENVDRLAVTIQSLENQLENEKNKNQILIDIVCMLLNSKKGQFIYWADAGWPKYETHTIVEAKLETVETDFFGREYKGKECLKIFIDDGDIYYIANNIGKNLFFTEEEAILHTSKGKTL